VTSEVFLLFSAANLIPTKKDRKSPSTPFSHSLLFRTLKLKQSRRDATHGSLNWTPHQQKFQRNVMKTRDCENVFESEGNHCALPGLADVGGLCSCYRVFRLLRNFWGAGLEDKFLMKNHSIGCLCLNYYFIPPSQSSPISNLPCSIHSRRSQLSLLKLVNLFLNLGRESIGGHCSPAHSITNAQNPQSGELGPPLSIFLKTKISPAESERTKTEFYNQTNPGGMQHTVA